jgi:hypothetical protein
LSANGFGAASIGQNGTYKIGQQIGQRSWIINIYRV